MIVHPAFKFGDEEIEGFWTAKFEASMVEENLNTEENNNVTDKTIKILPNVVTWRYIQIGNIFKNCLNMKENSIYRFSKKADTHQMKNSEWGAIAYLSASQYGKIPTKNELEESYVENGITKYREYAGGKDYIKNTAQSTTGNISGVYDMNGGAWEYVAAYLDNGMENLVINGTMYIFEEDEEQNYKLKSEYDKYFNKYKVGELEQSQGATIWNMKNTEGNKKSYQIANDRVNLMKNIKGDAMFEIINEWSYYGRYSREYHGLMAYEFQDWLKPIIDNGGNLIDTGEESLGQYGRSFYGEDFILIGTYNFPFVLRGGELLNGTASGIFASANYIGDSAAYSFRPVIV